MKKLICAVVLSLSLALPARLVFADSAQPPQKGPRPCKADVQKFCSEVKPGGGRIIECLKEHENDLSPQCKAALEKGMKPRSNGQTKPGTSNPEQ